MAHYHQFQLVVSGCEAELSSEFAAWWVYEEDFADWLVPGGEVNPLAGA